MIGLLNRLRKRKIVQWTLAYAAGAWVLLQVLGLMSDSFEWPHGVMQIAFGVAVLGFFVAIVLAWYHGERGEQHTSGAELVIIAALLGLGGAVLWRGHAGKPAPAASAPAATAPAVAAAATALAPAKSIAVLPFENLSGDPADAYLADGMQEEILNALARLRDMKVISRTSVMEYRGHEANVREIGERLGVRTILEGSVRRQGGRLRLTIQLIDAGADKHLLATNYDRDLKNVLGLQTTVARQVADALSATLTSYERGDFDRVATNSGDAYDRYLHAVALFRRQAKGDEDGLVEPRRLLKEALALDPDYADALALLAQVDIWSYFLEGADSAAAAKQAFEHALAIDPALPEAKMARGIYAIYVTQDLDQAITDLDAVATIRPNSAEAHMLLGFALRRRGRMDEALAHLTRAWDLDPLNPVRDGGPITTLLGLRRLPEAIHETELASARFPNQADSYFVRARLQGRLQHSLEPLRATLRQRGSLLDAEERLAVGAEIAQAEGRYLDAIKAWQRIPSSDDLARGKRVGLLYLAAGDAAAARKQFENALQYWHEHERELQQSEDLVDAALVQSLLGEHADAIATIDAAHAQFGEAVDAINGPQISFARSLILVRAGRRDEGIAEATRLLKVPFGAPFSEFFGPEDGWDLWPEAKTAPFDALINDPPRL